MLKLKIKLNYNSIINFLTSCLLCSFTIFEMYSWGRYVILGGALLVFLVSVVRDSGRANLYIEPFSVMILLFAFYTGLSTLWAIDASDAIAKFRTLIEIFVVMYVLYIAYRGNENCVRDLLNVIKWSSYFIVLYSIFFYGLDTLYLMARSEQRIDNDYANSNTIGMLAAVGVVIQVDRLFEEKRFLWESCFAVFSLLVITITQSRKALLILIIGILGDIIIRNVQSKRSVKSLLKLLFGIVFFVFVMYMVLSLPVFSGIMARMQSLMLMFSGEAGADTSALMRGRMIEIGLAHFIKDPVLGVGIGCPHHIALIEAGKDSYLHNNFIELLCGGGIVGFLLYYSMYIYLFYIFFKCRRFKDNIYIVCLSLCITVLLMDLAMVSYYNKIRYIYLLCFFLEAESLKRCARNTQKKGRLI